jgi:hypothetical protein
MKIVGHADYQTTREFQTMSFYLLFNLLNLWDSIELPYGRLSNANIGHSLVRLAIAVV